MEQLIETAINQYGYLAIIILLVVENIFPPIPSELILTFAGFLTYQGQLNIFGAICAATLGALIGASLLYWIGTYLNRERLAKLVDSRLGRILRLRLADFEKAESHFQRHGRAAVFFGRFIPVVRSLISVPAGMTKMPFLQFLVFTFAGSAIWNTVLISLGHIAGKAWTKMLVKVDSITGMLTWLLVALVVVGVVIYGLKRLNLLKRH
ncbi:DedA family protein [Weissella halotolerans]|nr:DedA family protein [Weissella halotolerans]